MLAARKTITLEWVVAVQVVLFMVAVSWAFGGNADWVREPLSILGSAGIVLTILIAAVPGFRSQAVGGTFGWAWPVVLLNGLVAASCFHPGFKLIAFGAETLAMPIHVPWWLPSASGVRTALGALWLFDGIYFSSFNVALGVRSRHVLRFIVASAVGNALLLAVFGIIQKFNGSTGIFFGAYPSPNGAFFASFVYDNHWAAFMLLMSGACIGLVVRYAHGFRGSGFFQGPAVAGILSECILATSVPLSGARACTLLVALQTGVGIIFGLPRIVSGLEQAGVARRGAQAGIAIACAVALGGAWLVAGDVIQERASVTRLQIWQMLNGGEAGSRGALYRDTARMARDRILFGWGMGSYPTVFPLYNLQEPSRFDRFAIVYHDAHSDWLQSVAELGIAGSALIAGSVLLPAATLRRSPVAPLPFFLLSGCVLVAAYAWIEFPFGNVAVVLGWWLCFFTAVQYVRLSKRGESQHSDA